MRECQRRPSVSMHELGLGVGEVDAVGDELAPGERVLARPASGDRCREAGRASCAPACSSTATSSGAEPIEHDRQRPHARLAPSGDRGQAHGRSPHRTSGRECFESSTICRRRAGCTSVARSTIVRATVVTGSPPMISAVVRPHVAQLVDEHARDPVPTAVGDGEHRAGRAPRSGCRVARRPTRARRRHVGRPPSQAAHRSRS